MTIERQRDLLERLDAIVTRASAVTLDDPSAATIDEHAVLAELDAARVEIEQLGGELEPPLAQLEARLRATLARAPAELARAAADHRFSTIKWRPDPPPMPRRLTAFVVLERIGQARHTCQYLLAKARYEALCRPDDRCDCAARVGAAFFAGEPEAPLRVVDSAGVPFAAMDYLLVCEACGARWSKETGYDDLGEHVTWAPAPPA